MNKIIEEVAGVHAIEEKAVTIIQSAKLPIVDQESYNAGADILKGIKGLRKEIETTFKPAIDAAHKAHKAVLEAMKQHDKPLEDAESYLKKTLSAWYSEQERIRKEAENKARKEAEEKARKAREEAEAEAKKQIAEQQAINDIFGLNDAIQIPAPQEQKNEPIIIPASIPTEKGGLKFREVWKFEVIDPLAVPREYLMVDETKIGTMVRSLKSSANIAGVRVYSEKVGYA